MAGFEVILYGRIWVITEGLVTFGRCAQADDVVVPTRNLTERTSPDAQHSLGLDLDLWACVGVEVTI